MLWTNHGWGGGGGEVLTLVSGRNILESNLHMMRTTKIEKSTAQHTVHISLKLWSKCGMKNIITNANRKRNHIVPQSEASSPLRCLKGLFRQKANKIRAAYEGIAHSMTDIFLWSCCTSSLKNGSSTQAMVNRSTPQSVARLVVFRKRTTWGLRTSTSGFDAALSTLRKFRSSY